MIKRMISRHREKSSETKRRIEQLWGKGLGRQAISKRTGLSVEYVGKLLGELKLTSVSAPRTEKIMIGRVRGCFKV